MATVNHSVLSQPNLHPAFNLIYRSEADRIAGTNEVNNITLAAANIGQLAKQLDNNSYWELLTVTPSITWALISGGTKAKTTADIDVYISTTGNDTTGDGSLSTSYATFTRALRDIQDKDLRHKATIHPAAGTYTAFPNYLDLTIGPGGRLVIDASGETSPVVAGPFTVNAATGVGPVGPLGTSLATDVQVTGSPGWSVNAYYTKFIHVLTGNWAGHLLPIFKNTADTIRTYFDWQTWAPGDTFNIVSCPVVIDVDNEIHIVGQTPGEAVYNSNQPQLLIGGVEFQIKTGNAFLPPMYLRSLSTILSFVNLVDVYNSDANSIPLVIRDGNLNFVTTPASTFANDKLEVWLNYALAIIPLNGAQPAATGIDLALIGNITGNGVGSMMCRRLIYSASSDDSLLWLMTGGYTNQLPTQVRAISRGSSTLSHVYVEQIGFTTVGLNIGSKKVSATSVYIEAANQPIILDGQAYAVFDWLKGGTIGAPYALQINRGSQMVIPTVADVTILGTTGAVTFTFDGTNHAVWPISGAFHSKVNSFVVSE